MKGFFWHIKLSIFLLLISCLGFCEDIYTINAGFLGEMFHLGAALQFKTDAYLYIDGYSDFLNPLQRRDELLSNLSRSAIEETELKKLNNGFKAYSFFKDIGLVNRIIVDPKARFDSTGHEDELSYFKGKYIPNHTDKTFETPTWGRYRAATKVIENYFTEHPDSAQSYLIKALNKDLPRDRENKIINYADQIKHQLDQYGGVMVWNRQGEYQKDRNMTEEAVLKICESVRPKKCMLFGPKIPNTWTRVQALITSGKAISCSEHWSNPIFSDIETSIIDQMRLFHHLKDKVAFQIGMQSGIMDAILFSTGLTTIELETKQIDYELNNRRISSLFSAMGDHHAMVISVPPLSSVVIGAINQVSEVQARSASVGLTPADHSCQNSDLFNHSCNSLVGLALTRCLQSHLAATNN